MINDLIINIDSIIMNLPLAVRLELINSTNIFYSKTWKFRNLVFGLGPGPRCFPSPRPRPRSRHWFWKKVWPRSRYWVFFRSQPRWKFAPRSGPKHSIKNTRKSNRSDYLMLNQVISVHIKTTETKASDSRADRISSRCTQLKTVHIRSAVSRTPKSWGVKISPGCTQVKSVNNKNAVSWTPEG